MRPCLLRKESSLGTGPFSRYQATSYFLCQVFADIPTQSPFLFQLMAASAILATMRYLIIFVACLFVSGSMAFIFIRFLKRLRQIEEEKWGSKASHRQS